MNPASPADDAQPTGGSAPAPAGLEPAVDGEAVELYETPVAPAPIAMPAAPAGAIPAVPVVATAPPPPVQPLPPIGSASSIPGAFDGHAPEPSVNPIGEIAGERPEVLVGAAFAGGILAAMILRRLGN
ncbi:MAG TPA: hypothetical protein VGF63_10995 [Solirubrobacteraceae bacterium]